MTDRRSFIAKAAAIGVETTLGAGATAQRRLNTRVRRPSMRTRGGADDSITLESVPPIARANDPAPADPPENPLPDAGAGVPQPMSKDALLNALMKTDGGEAALAGMDVSNSRAGDGAGAFAPSGNLAAQIIPGNLADAYAAGITLTPTGCEYAEGFEFEEEPLRYATDSGRITPDTDLDTVLTYTIPQKGGMPMYFFVQTPGGKDDFLSYSVELAGWCTYPNLKLTAAWNGGDPVQWTKTSTGARMSLVELGGGEQALPAQAGADRRPERLGDHARQLLLPETAGDLDPAPKAPTEETHV